MGRYPQADLASVRTISIAARRSKVRFADFAKPVDPRRASFRTFERSLPRILAAGELRAFADDVAAARRKGKPVIVLMGAHVVKVGLAPVLIDLMRRGTVTAVAMNSAAAIHDAETALFGRTSEDVEARLGDGTFGMSRQTGDFINGTLTRVYRRPAPAGGSAGYGEALGEALRKAPHARVSILAAAWKLGIPATVHAAIGTDIVHQQPGMNGAATGELSFRDFKVLCHIVAGLTKGGVVMNIGSAVILPEVFLKALTVARNLGAPARGFAAANFDMLQHYRPRLNVVLRPTRGGGKGYFFTGHHEIMIPLAAAMINARRGGR